MYELVLNCHWSWNTERFDRWGRLWKEEIGRKLVRRKRTK